MKTGVIVDAFASGSLLAPAFKKAGYQLIHVRSTEKPTIAYINAPFHTDDFILDLYEPNKEKLVALLKEHDVQFVIPGIEISIELADFLSEALQLRTNGTKLSAVRRNKFDMVELIRQKGLHTAKQIKTSSEDEMITFAKSLPMFHVVLKPLRSAGTELVFIVTGEQDARQAFRKILSVKTQFDEKNEAVCVQEYLVGHEYVVDTVSANGKTVVTDVWLHNFAEVNGVKDFYDYDELISPADPSVQELCDYTIKAVEALGIMWGPAHPEIMLTKNGPAVIEIGARMGGAGLPRLAQIGLGKGQVEYTVAAYTDEKLFNEMAAETPTIKNHCLWVCLLSYETGTLKNMDKFTEIEKLPSFYEKIIEVNVDGPIKKTVDLTSTPGFVFLVHPDKEILMKDYRRIRELEKNGLFEVV
ncbi:MAG: ATP-grasp domain-containing protein [Candidatus Levyibacteriota bacterium]